MRDLFDPPASDDTGLPAFDQAFEAWADHVRRHRLLQREPSVDAYRVIWGGFVRWCRSQQPPVALHQLTDTDLALFIQSRTGAAGPDSDLTPRYVWRLLHLIDRVLVHQAHQAHQAHLAQAANQAPPGPPSPPASSPERRPEPRPGARPAAARATAPALPVAGGAAPAGPDPAPANRCALLLLNSRPDWRYANAATRDTLPDHLSAGQARLLVNHLSQARPRGSRLAATATWQELRNHAAVGLQLGAGLTPGEVRALRLQHVVVDGGRQHGLPWKLQVPGDGDGAEREAPLARWAGLLLRHWLDVRREQALAGEQLFPSTRSGKPWGKVAHYGAVTRVLEASGIDKHLVPGGSFRLRHTFALRQLRRGKTPEEVARWLGVVDPAVMARYRRTVYAPVDDLA